MICINLSAANSIRLENYMHIELLYGLCSSIKSSRHKQAPVWSKRRLTLSPVLHSRHIRECRSVAGESTESTDSRTQHTRSQCLLCHLDIYVMRESNFFSEALAPAVYLTRVHTWCKAAVAYARQLERCQVGGEIIEYK